MFPKQPCLMPTHLNPNKAMYIVYPLQTISPVNTIYSLLQVYILVQDTTVMKKNYVKYYKSIYNCWLWIRIHIFLVSGTWTTNKINLPRKWKYCIFYWVSLISTILLHNALLKKIKGRKCLLNIESHGENTASMWLRVTWIGITNEHAYDV